MFCAMAAKACFQKLNIAAYTETATKACEENHGMIFWPTVKGYCIHELKTAASLVLAAATSKTARFLMPSAPVQMLLIQHCNSAQAERLYSELKLNTDAVYPTIMAQSAAA